MATEKLSTVIDQIVLLDETAEELGVSPTDVGRDSADVLVKGIDSIKHNLAEVLVKNGYDDLAQELNRKVKSII